MRVSFRLLAFGGLVAIGLLSLMAVPGWSDDKSPARQQQIAELEKQIQALSQKLSELRRTDTPTPAPSVTEGALPAEWVKSLTWRSIGPANMGGRITALAVFEADPSTYYVATASGGLLKTVNNGVTFEHQFDREATVSIGDVCVAPSDRNIVWVGTGENNPRNSVSYGDGVYKSTDGGRTWKNMGLKKSFQIGRLAIHPTNPNIVYVGALGRLYGPNEERGLYKTTNGGETWEKILYIDDKTGVIDMQMHPRDPETLLVATYERQRDGFDTNDPAKKWGPGSGLYKTTDGGKTFRKLTQGLPTCLLGRIGIDYYRKDPNTVYIILESEKIGMGPPPAQQAEPSAVYAGLAGVDQEDAGARLTRVVANGPAAQAGLQVDDVVVAAAGKPVRSYAQLLEQVRGYKPGDKVKVRVTRAGKELEVELTLASRPPGQTGQRGQRGGQAGQRGGQRGGETQRPFAANLGGQRENVQDQQGPDSFQYGGVYKSTDGGESWTRINSVNPRPMYFSVIRVDPSDDRHLYVLGVQLFRSSDGGKTFRADVRGFHVDQHALWINPKDGRHMIVGCDGGFYATYDRMANWDHLNHLAIAQFYHVAVDTRTPYRVYGGLQDNGSWGGPSRLRGQTGAVNEDWISIGGGDGFVCRVDPNDPDLVYWESQNGGFSRRNLRTGESASLRPRPQQGQTFRFNWNAPFILSHANSRIYYCAGNYVFRSLDRGNDPRVISPEITRTSRGSATALAESPRNPNVLYVGTDDGALWVTRDGGHEWTNLTNNVGLPGPRWVASIEASRFAEGRAYVALDGHRSDDDDPYVYVTEDYGKTWKSLRANLPWGSTRVLREDLQNPDLLFVGTEFAVWASVDRGASWTRLNNNLPTVAVHELALHPTAGEMVAATHGRSLWVLDVTPLRQMTAEVVKAKAHLYKPNTIIRWRPELARGRTNRRFVGQNPPPGAQFYYSLTAKAGKVSLKVVDYTGKTIRELPGRTEPGLHRVAWDLSLPPPQRGADTGAAPGAPGQRRGGGGGRGGGQGRGGAPVGPPAPPGLYQVVLTVDGQELVQSVRLEADPSLPSPLLIAADEDTGADNGKDPARNR
jgi:photosystem II stability/assembly factor-like uncharacterized protein